MKKKPWELTIEEEEAQIKRESERRMKRSVIWMGIAMVANLITMTLLIVRFITGV
jgi:hypothetical protein